ncbi:hypothetical protein BS78_09G241100 [Paspalum vaginatum]|nr:hypothetical protein BS78_09G241100 [Paspalum vaginatum]
MHVGLRLCTARCHGDGVAPAVGRPRVHGGIHGTDGAGASGEATSPSAARLAFIPLLLQLELVPSPSLHHIASGPAAAHRPRCEAVCVRVPAVMVTASGGRWGSCGSSSGCSCYCDGGTGGAPCMARAASGRGRSQALNTGQTSSGANTFEAAAQQERRVKVTGRAGDPWIHGERLAELVSTPIRRRPLPHL